MKFLKRKEEEEEKNQDAYNGECVDPQKVTGEPIIFAQRVIGVILV